MRSVHLLVKGKVQGVYYRASAKTKAGQLSITGWVKNTLEGYVEIIATGDEHAISEFILWCQTGPPHARVDDVEIAEIELRIFDAFSISRQEG